MSIRIAIAAFGLLLPLTGLAADDGELWEVTTQMNIPGMPAGMAGMGGGAQRVCTGKDPKEDATRRPDMQKCKVVDLKQTATRMTLTMSCPDGQAVIDQTYNAARTEYKGTMTMKSKDGDMVINTAGRKVGTCDVQQARKSREEKSAKMKGEMEAQIAAGQRQQAESQRQMNAQLVKMCDESVASMDARRFPGKEHLKNMPAEARTACDTRRSDYCKKLQTEAGFSQAARLQENMPAAGTLCAVQPAKLQATLCSGALKNESLNFLARQCPAEAKQGAAKFCPKASQTAAYDYLGRHCKAEAQALFKKDCAGRSYTSQKDAKKREMCNALAGVEGEDSGSGQSAAASKPAAKAAEATKGTAAQQVEQGFGKGLDKIKGLFGR
jgi:hypothetical protein